METNNGHLFPRLEPMIPRPKDIGQAGESNFRIPRVQLQICPCLRAVRAVAAQRAVSGIVSGGRLSKGARLRECLLERRPRQSRGWLGSGKRGGAEFWRLD